jgi:predicted ATPase
MGMKTIQSVSIRNYRGLADTKVNGLDRVNVLVGRNGTGKTSLLEALALACLGNQPEQLIMVSLARGGVFNQRSLESIYGSRDQPASIQLDTSDGQYGLTIKPPGEAGAIIRQTERGPEAMQTHFTIELIHHRPDGSGGTKEHPCRLDLRPEGLSILKERNGTNHIEAFYLPCRSASQSSVRALISKLTAAAQEARLVDVLRVCDERVRDVRLLDDDIQIELDQRVRLPLASLGDGASRLAQMAEGLLNDQASVILLDEIDSGLHHSVMERFWDHLLALMDKRPFQLFCTTHDEEMLAATLGPFLRQGKTDWLRKVAMTRHSNGGIVANVSNYDDLRYQIENEYPTRT